MRPQPPAEHTNHAGSPRRIRMRPVLLAILFTLSASAASAAQETPVIPGGASPPRADTRHCDRSRVEMIDAVPADSAGQPYFDREVRHALEEASKARVFAPLPDGVAADSLPLWFYFGRRAEGGGKFLADRT